MLVFFYIRVNNKEESEEGNYNDGHEDEPVREIQKK